ncbi:hypothetical protein ACFFMR_00040 [Micromonospora andamanensis]|uniref:Uncharacterized protein n=1 Tax=Micromonospora andamanensis TaxID=1287068 RepID=A0ABQ4I2D2_9ACTN|nr:hypothetical protein [Micromonospora andamanensis]GIJ12048.1 hypothetical protein Van01_52620 [Micromonospora andamanensis]GIJ40267.1 hypothetical protein Vwe01_35920 [Micromonospora andamanensis]
MAIRSMKDSGRRGRSVLRGAATVALAAGMLAGLPGVAAADPVDDSGDHCVIVLDRLKPGQTESDVVAQKCSDDPADLSHVGTMALTPLVTFYEHAGYGGKSRQLSGEAGTCDAAGYGFSSLTWDYQGGKFVSSFVTHGACNQVRGFYNTQYSGYTERYTGSRSYVGDRLNDHIYSMTVWNG